MHSLTLRLLGPPSIKSGHTPIKIGIRKAFGLLAYLAVTNQMQSRELLTTLLWPEAEPKRAKASLRSTLAVLKKHLGRDWLLVDGQSIGLNQSADIWVDVVLFRQIVEQSANREPREGSTYLSRLQEGITFYQGDFLAGFNLSDSLNFDEWQLFERENLRQTMMAGLETLIQGYRLAGQFEAAIDCARQLVTLDPLYEGAYHQLMTLYAESGQRRVALTQYQICQRVFETELGMPPSAEIEALYQNLRRQSDSPNQQPRPAGPPHPLSNLPTLLTPFIGRNKALIAIKKRLIQPTCRLLTLIGPGGVGKTRLAIQVAKQLTSFQDGIFYVDLASLQPADSLASAILQTLNVSVPGVAKPEQQLGHYLANKVLFLLLDNFEHLLDQADLLPRLLSQAPQVKIMVTSRQNLAVAGEWHYPVTGFSIPESHWVADWDNYSSIRLFAQLAHQLNPTFRLAQEAEAVVRICQLVDGLPLGIELATVWVNVLSCEKIAQEVANNLDFLASQHRTTPFRHRSMRAVFEHSWQLLSETEQQMLAQASVFQGGFTEEAFITISQTSLLAIYHLVNKSLLKRVEAGRYEMHQLLKQFAAEKLQTHTNLAEISQASHATYYGDYLQTRAGWWESDQKLGVISSIEIELQNIHCGWHWAVYYQPPLLNNYLDSLFAFYETKGLYQEGFERFELALSHLYSDLLSSQKATNLLLAKLLTRQAEFCTETGQIELALERIERSVALLQGQDDEMELAFAYKIWGGILYFQGNYQQAKEMLGRSLAVTESGLSMAKTANIYLLLGAVEFALGAYQQAKKWQDGSLQLTKQINYRFGMGQAHRWLGIISQTDNQYAEARYHYQQSLTLFQQLKDVSNVSLVYNSLTLLEQRLGNYRQAQQLAEQSLQLYQGYGWQPGVIHSLNYLGHISRLSKDYQMAKAYLQQALRLAIRENYPPLALKTVLNIATLLLDKDTDLKPLPDNGQQMPLQSTSQAFQILTMISHHSAASHDLRQQAEQQRAHLLTHLPKALGTLLQTETTILSEEAVLKLLEAV